MDYTRARRFLDTLPDWESGRPHLGPLGDNLPRMRALLQRLGNPQERFDTVIVGGTNGKGTVSSLLANLVSAAGHTTGLYTSPHLHTIRERIQVGGALLGKDRWARGIGELFDHTRDFESEGLGPISRFEALTALAALVFAQEGVEKAVFEVGLGGTYDATNAWDSEAAVITSIGLDHTEILGNDVVQIAADKLAITRTGCPLFTTVDQEPEVLEHIRTHCGGKAVPLFIVDSHGGNVEAVGPALTPPPWTLCDESWITPERPRTYAENARLAVAAGSWLCAGSLLPDGAARAVVGHYWPGRFERAGSDHPIIILDGAHNAPSASALAADLRTISDRWHIGIGILEGHDGKAILEALAPLAKTLVITDPDHPRGKAPEVLQRDCQVPASVQVPYDRAFRTLLERAGRDGHICITGSLTLVARAREFFSLPFEREGMSEDLALESLTCVEEACRRLQLQAERVSANGNVLRTHVADRPVYFIRNRHPFNDVAAARLAEDKGYQYELFSKAGLPVPFSMQVFNPYADDRFNRYKSHNSIDDIVAHIDGSMDYPVLVKKYRSSVSEGVYLERDASGVAARLGLLFENASFLDNTVIIQHFIAGREFRAVASQDELLLAYEKTSDCVTRDTASVDSNVPNGDLNPLHDASGRAEPVGAGDLRARLSELVTGVAEVVDLGLYAIDVIDSVKGAVILEINPNPFCYFYNRSNGREEFVKIYEYLIHKYLKNSKLKD